MKTGETALGSTSSSHFAKRIERPFILLAATALAAALSIATHGFKVGESNNFYQIPIFEHWSSSPVFSADPFIGSLRYYVSGVWGLLARLPSRVDTGTAFLVLHFVTRWATLLVFSAVATSLGIRRLSALLALTFWWALAATLHGLTPVGVSELFVGYFTHTEMALPLVLLALLMAARGRVFWAFAITGLLADINIFYAVWAAVALVVAVLVWPPQGARKQVLFRSAGGIAVAIGLALPVAYWTFTALVRQPPHPPFDYVQFLRAYYPNHFLIESADLSDVMILAGTVVTAGVAFRTFGSSGRVWKSAFWGFGLVFLAGAVLPRITHNASLLNLHLLRVDGVLTTLAVLLLSVLAARKLVGADRERLAGAAALLMLSLPNPAGIIFAAVLIAAEQRHERSASETVIWLLVCVGAVVCGIPHFRNQSIAEGLLAIGCLNAGPFANRMRVPGTIALISVLGVTTASYTAYRMVAGRRSDDLGVNWAVQEAANWARQHTNTISVFMVPVRLDPIGGPKAWLNDPYSRTDYFSLFAKRRVWVSWKQGAAVMWSPSYYGTWWTRMSEVSLLGDPANQLAYACGHQIDYVLLRKSGAPTPQLDVVHENSRLMIVKVPGQCQPIR